jgi:hypothetical protein
MTLLRFFASTRALNWIPKPFLFTVERLSEKMECAMSRLVSLVPGVIVERVGGDLLVSVPDTTEVVHLNGKPAQVLLSIQAGLEIDQHDPSLATLVDLGIVQASGMSRRGLIKAGAIGVGAGLAVMSMPSVAAASSDSDANDDGESATNVPLLRSDITGGAALVFIAELGPTTPSGTVTINEVLVAEGNPNESEFWTGTTSGTTVRFSRTGGVLATLRVRITFTVGGLSYFADTALGPPPM